MNTLVFLLVVANLALSAVLLALWTRGQRKFQALTAQAAALQQAGEAIPADLNRLLGEQNTRVIAIEILNPVELATNKTLWAKPLSGMSPGMINKLVYKEAREIIAEQLPEFGVDAEVRIYGG